MPMVARPTTNDGVEALDEHGLAGTSVQFDKSPYLLQKGPPVFERRLDEQFSTVFPQILPQEVEAFFHMREPGLFRRKCQPAFQQEGFHQRFDLIFQQ